MSASLETLLAAAYEFADSIPIPRAGPKGKITDPELIALAVAQAVTGEPSDRKFLGMIGYRPSSRTRACAIAYRSRC